MSLRNREHIRFNKYTLAEPAPCRREQNKVRQALLEWLLDENFRALPITVTFRKTIRLKNGEYQRLDVLQLQETIRHLMRRVNRRVLGRKAFKEGARLQAQFVWEDSEDRGLHAHGRIELPRPLTDWELEEILDQEAERLDWILYARLDPDDRKDWIEYILKLKNKGTIEDHFDDVNSWWIR